MCVMEKRILKGAKTIDWNDELFLYKKVLHFVQ